MPLMKLYFIKPKDEKVSIAVRFEKENMWLTQKLMVDLFEIDVRTVSEDLKMSLAMVK